MPGSAPARSSSLPSNFDTTSTIGGPSTIRSLPDTEDTFSEDGSDISSVSLISAPVSEDEDEALWQATRAATESTEYVVLYDSAEE